MKNNSIKEKISELYLNKVMEDAFSRYAKYIIQDRALPDVRDGLKPVQRRILFAMYNLGLLHDKPYKKSARTVGEVIGKYHPHGDSSIYEAMILMSQDWKKNIKLIDIQGNNGSIDGDSPAAMRYTEARLSEASCIMIGDINKNTIKWLPNFDDSEQEPEVLPSLFPNLLINGSSGIAAGYATNIAPYNPNEIFNALIELIKNPNLNNDQLNQIILGPDFPTGGIILSNSEIQKSNNFGKGKIVISAGYEFNFNNKNYDQIIINSIPYDVKKSDIIKTISSFIINDTLPDLIDVRDESDKNELKIVIDLKKGCQINKIYSYLLKKTNLEIYFNINNTVIYNKKPVIMSILSMLKAYLEHAYDVIIKTAIYDKNKVEEKIEIYEGLIIALSNLDKTIQIIRTSNNKQEASDRLIAEFSINAKQSEAILQLKLYKLTNTDINEIKNELTLLKQKYLEYCELIENKKIQDKFLINIYKDYKKIFGYERKTIIQDPSESNLTNTENIHDILISESEHNLIVTKNGYLKLLSNKSLLTIDNNPDLGIKGDDEIVLMQPVLNTEILIIYSSDGKTFNIPLYKLKEQKLKDQGTHINTLFDNDHFHNIINAQVIKKDDNLSNIVYICVSKHGMIKKGLINELYNKNTLKSYNIMKFKNESDQISSVISFNQQYVFNVFLVTENGIALKFDHQEIPLQSKSSSGVLGIKLKSDDAVRKICLMNEENNLLISFSKGYIIINSDIINKTHRATAGKRIIPTQVSLAAKINNICLLNDQTYICNDNNEINKLILASNNLNLLMKYPNNIKNSKFLFLKDINMINLGINLDKLKKCEPELFQMKLDI